MIIDFHTHTFPDKIAAAALAPTSAWIDTAFSLGSMSPLDETYYKEEERELLAPEAFCALVQAFGGDRVVFGTDSPWDGQAVALKAIQALPLIAEEKEKILGGNAQRILG